MIEADRTEATIALADSLVLVAQERLESIPLLSSGEKGELRRYLNPVHTERAALLGVERPMDRGDVPEYYEDSSLVRIKDNPYYRVLPMDFGVPAVTPDMAVVLEEIGAMFQAELAEEGLPPFRYTVTSALRTAKDQARLRGSNVNASKIPSSHERGTTVDVSYTRFDYAGNPDTPLGSEVDPDLLQEVLEQQYSRLATEYKARLMAILGRVLDGLQDEGEVLVIYERRNTVYHLTVGRQQEEDPEYVTVPPPS